MLSVKTEKRFNKIQIANQMSNHQAHNIFEVKNEHLFYLTRKTVGKQQYFICSGCYYESTSLASFKNHMKLDRHISFVKRKPIEIIDNRVFFC